MLSTIVTIATAVGGLIIAGLSAYAAYKKSTNKGTHTLTTSYGQFETRNVNNNDHYDYASLFNNTPTQVIQPVQQTYNVGVDLDMIAKKVNEIIYVVNRITDTVSKVVTAVNSIIANIRNNAVNIPQPNMSYVQQPIQQPVQQPIATTQVIDTTATETNNRAWEDSGDEAVAKINNGVNPAVETTPVAAVPVAAAVPVSVPTHTTRLPVSEVGINALNCNYTFNMADGFDQFYDSDLYRRVTADRYQNFQQPKYCDMGDPYGGLPASITGGVSYQINPYATPVGPVMGYPSEPIVCDKPKDLICHYGHVGLPNPSTRQSYHYGNI